MAKVWTSSGVKRNFFGKVSKKLQWCFVIKMQLFVLSVHIALDCKQSLSFATMRRNIHEIKWTIEQERRGRELREARSLVQSPGFKVALILIYPTSLFSDTSYLLTYRIDTSWLTRGDTIKDLWFPLFAWSFKEYITCLQEIPIPLLLMFITPSHGSIKFSPMRTVLEVCALWATRGNSNWKFHLNISKPH